MSNILFLKGRMEGKRLEGGKDGRMERKDWKCGRVKDGWKDGVRCFGWDS